MDIFLENFSCDVGTSPSLDIPQWRLSSASALSVGSGVDVSSADNIQVEHGADISINIKFDKVVDLDDAAYGATNGS